jgi:hypothetical protein
MTKRPNGSEGVKASAPANPRKAQIVARAIKMLPEQLREQAASLIAELTGTQDVDSLSQGKAFSKLKEWALGVDPARRALAIAVMAHLPKARKLMPAIVAPAMTGPDKDLRYVAVAAILRCGPHEQLKALLLAALNDADAAVRSRAAKGIAASAGWRRALWYELATLSRTHSDPRVRAEALRALEKLGPGGPDALARLTCRGAEAHSLLMASVAGANENKQFRSKEPEQEMDVEEDEYDEADEDEFVEADEEDELDDEEDEDDVEEYFEVDDSDEEEEDDDDQLDVQAGLGRPFPQVVGTRAPGRRTRQR